MPPRFYKFLGNEHKPHMDDELFTFLNTEPLERKRRELRELRQASEHNRMIIADGSLMQEAYRQKVRTNVSASKTAYYRLHSNYFAKSPQRMHNADSGLLEIGDYVRRRGTRNFYEANVGSHRIVDTHVGMLINLSKFHLPEIEDLFFEAVDAVNESNLQTKREVLYFVALCDLIELMCHFPFDVSGRSDEDFMVWLAHAHGVELSISRTGYRGFVDAKLVQDILQLRSSTIRPAIIKKVIRGMMKDLEIGDQGLNLVDADEDFIESLKNALNGVLEKQKSNVSLSAVMTENLYYDQLQAEVKTMISLLSNLKNPGKGQDSRSKAIGAITKRYPEIIKLVNIYEQGTKRKFLYAPPGTDKLCDSALTYGLLVSEIEPKNKLVRPSYFGLINKALDRARMRLKAKSADTTYIDLIAKEVEAKTFLKLTLPRLGEFKISVNRD